jgi:hypothetical protein
MNNQYKTNMDKKNGCQACHYEKYNTKKSREPHTCGKRASVTATEFVANQEARGVYNDIINHNNMCRQPNTPLSYKHEALMNELNDFMIAVKVHLNPELFGDAIGNVKNRHPKPTITDIDSLAFRLRHVLQQDATPFVKY